MTTAASASSDREFERRSRAFLRLLATICRQFPDLRNWLMEDFGRDPETRANFLAIVERGDLNGEAMSNGFSEVAGELDGWIEEKCRLKKHLPVEATCPFGGLTCEKMEALVRRYEARSVGLNVFQLVRDWRKAGTAAKASPRLLRAGADLLDMAIRSGDRGPIVELCNAVDLLAGLDSRRLRRSFGYADWWKLNALVYMLRNPREAYRTREVRAHLESLGLQISSLDFRRFCKRHDIRRDERAGRPPARIGERGTGKKGAGVQPDTS